MFPETEKKFNFIKFWNNAIKTCKIVSHIKAKSRCPFLRLKDLGTVYEKLFSSLKGHRNTSAFQRHTHSLFLLKNYDIIPERIR